MVRARDVITIYKTLSANKIKVWLVGGWGIDALLQQETRPHKDLDILKRIDDVVRMRDLLGRDGFSLKELWLENSWTLDSHGIEVPTAFVLQDSEGREVDAHAMRLDGRGSGIPAWAEEEIILKRQELAGEGMIAGFPVRCISPEMQVLVHAVYDLPHEHQRDLELLRDRLGVE
jgi:lincosamide nucleotidyltransferase A/C/D/E